MKMETRITKEISMEVDRVDIMQALNKHLNLDNPIPANAEIFINVPGGGDWSNSTLTLGDQITGVYIKYRAVEIE